MDDKRYQVNIPANVKIRTELINGIGIKELITTAIAGTISIFIDLFIKFKKKYADYTIYILTTKAVARKISLPLFRNLLI